MDEWSQHQTQLMQSTSHAPDEWAAGEFIDEYELASQQQNESATDSADHTAAADEADAAVGQRQEPVEREDSCNWSDRTKKVMVYLDKKFEALGVSHDGPDAHTSFAEMCAESGQRRAVSRFFFEMLVLKKDGMIDLQQQQPYSDIRISKTKAFDSNVPREAA
jgi:chromatin segregation and condensation protein Rec8/ScpA/Scc1 (kleisin family)